MTFRARARPHMSSLRTPPLYRWSVASVADGANSRGNIVHGGGRLSTCKAFMASQEELAGMTVAGIQETHALNN